MTLGRTICGWLCPLGLLQELLNKIPVLKIRKNRVTRALSWLKYVILALFVVAIPLWYGLRYEIPLPGFCKYICPAGTFEGAMGHLANPANASYYSMLGILFTRKFVIMLVIALACVFCYRSFCRFICPLGAIYGLFNRFNVIGVKVDAARCNHCGACVRSCGMDVRRVGDHECINCGKCMDACNQGAISIKAGKITLKAPEKGCAGDGPDAPEKRKKLGRALWGAALAVLCFALVWFNLLDPAVREAAKPTGTVEASATAEPAATEEAVATEAPAATEEPTVTEESAATEAPATTEEPAVTEEPTEVETFVAESFESDAPDTAPSVSDSGRTAYAWTFTPTDSKNYVAATGTLKLTVNPSAITITADDRSSRYGNALRKLTYQVGGAYVKGAQGYDVFFSVYNGKDNFTRVKTTKALGCTIKHPKKRRAYKAYVVAWKKEGKKKACIGRPTPLVHCIVGGYSSKSCNAGKVTVADKRLMLVKGKSEKIEATVVGVKAGKEILRHSKPLRYYSSDANVATVTQKGKVKAVGKGRCKIIVMANNGICATVKVSVK